MRSELDPLRAAPLPDSFGRTAAWLRETPPPRPRRAPAVSLVALLVIAACSWPVRTPVASGSVIEVLSTDSLRADHPTVRALDEMVPDGHRQLVELETRDADEGGGSVLRYTVFDADAETVGRWRDSVEALPGTQATRVLTVGMSERRPLGLRTVARVLRVAPGSRLSDRELRSELNSALREVAPLRIRVERTANGSRLVRVEGPPPARSGDAVPATAPRARIAKRPGGGAFVIVERSRDADTLTAPQVFTLGGKRVDSLSTRVWRASPPGLRLSREGFSLTGQRLARPTDVSVELALDSLAPSVARSLRDQLDVRLRQLDGAAPTPLDSFRVVRLAGPDSLRSFVRVDTLHRTLRITIVRDTL